ncbi:hypothetical protein AAAK29_29815 [Mesorhizobium sp. CCNWLW179-1]|uniref:hypothetical protein n=1 Tax=unclassified Mesorhizobium TaxID=325217 RepID=UPI003014F1C9
MIIIIWLGALFIVGGVLYMAKVAIFQGRLSDPHSSPTATRTLEPSRSGIRVFGLRTNWPGLFLIAIGTIMLLLGTLT